MDSIKATVTGDRQVGLRFEEFPDQLYDDLRREIDALAHELLGRIQAATPVLSGQLRSQERVRVFADKDKIKGYIDLAAPGKDRAKAAALEYGAHRNAKVKSYSRTVDVVFGEHLDAPVTQIVKAHSRPTNIMEHAFERGPLADMSSEIQNRSAAVVKNAVDQANR